MAEAHTTMAETPSAIEDKEKLADDTSTDEEQPAVLENNSKDAIEYPKGIKLGIIVIALVLSVFLISLDMVNTIRPPIPQATSFENNF